IDGYFWLLQAEESLATGALRVRETSRDNAPAGREVHWAGFQRWWTVGLAAAYRVAHPGLTLPQALERVAPWANTALVTVFLLALAPLVAARLGAVPAAMLSLAVFPFYEYVRVGYLDHHGPAILTCLASVLFLSFGGSGWVRAAELDAARRKTASGASLERLPEPRSARRWFIASGVM